MYKLAKRKGTDGILYRTSDPKFEVVSPTANAKKTAKTRENKIIGFVNTYLAKEKTPTE
jgi:hypothetical protein